MQINFYNTANNNKDLVKDLSNVVKIIQDAGVYNECSVMNPVLLLNYDSNIVKNSNYFYIPEWDTYYFMNHDIKALPGGRMIISGHEDVLMSNADIIRNLNVYAIRSASNRNPNLPDSKIPMEVQRNCQTIAFNASPFQGYGYNFVLQVIGGATRNV